MSSDSQKSQNRLGINSECEKVNHKSISSQIKKGDVDSFKNFYQLVYPRLKNFAFQMISDTSAVEDILQDAFLKIWETREFIDYNKSLSGLLFKIVRNNSINYLKHNKNEKKYIEAQIVKKSYQELYLFDFLTVEESEKLHVESLSKVMSIINELPEKCRLVFSMSKLEEKKHLEISESLNISVKSVEKHITKAYKIIRKRIKDY